MEYKNVIEDFVARTRHNLHYIRETARAQSDDGDSGATVYEFTQLVNSMLGLLVFPQERFFDSIPTTPLRELEEAGWPSIRVSDGFPDTVDNLKDLMRYLRNAVAHFNMQFLTRSSQLSGVRVWNTRRGKRTWQADLSIEDLEQITERFIDLVLSDTSRTRPSGAATKGGCEA